MKKTFKPFVAACFAAMLFFACSKEVKETEEEISQETIAKIKSLGFGTSDLQKTEGGYLVEGDIILTQDRLNEIPTSPTLRIAGDEQYRTNNLVFTGGGARNITVSVSGSVSSGFSNAVNAAIARYNAQNLLLNFSRVTSGGNINIRIINTGQYIASAGFPSGGNPYNEIKYAKKYTNYSNGFMTTVLAHEIGHCIGFRHTDYMNRAYSCGSGGSEGAGTIGAVHISGTPTGPDAASWMLACLSSSTNRPFNSNDIIALKTLY